MADTLLVSVIIPTRNSASTLERCLASLRAQDVPRNRMEIILCDAGSDDATLDIARRHQIDHIIANPRKTAEAGKAVALQKAQGEFVAFIDSDNELMDSRSLSRLLAPLEQNPALALSEPLYFHWDRSLPSIDRYCALMGLNDPLCYYTGNFDRWNYRLDAWTRLPILTEDRGDFLEGILVPGSPAPTLGANGSVFRRTALLSLPLSDFYFDVDIPPLLAAQGFPRFAKVKVSVLHHYSATLGVFLRKQRRRITDYLCYRPLRAEKELQRGYSRLGRLLFILCALLQIPCWWTAWAGYRRKPDPAWFWHGPLCLATLLVYGAIWLQARCGVGNSAESAS
jgi:glycosyltransferase involved in cell wall biosynthesis